MVTVSVTVNAGPRTLVCGRGGCSVCRVRVILSEIGVLVSPAVSSSTAAIPALVLALRLVPATAWVGGWRSAEGSIGCVDGVRVRLQ